MSAAVAAWCVYVGVVIGVAASFGAPDRINEFLVGLFLGVLGYSIIETVIAEDRRAKAMKNVVPMRRRQ